MPGIPTPLDVIRVLPRCGLQLVVPAMGVGAVWCSMLDILLGHEGYPLAMAGLVLGPVAFGLAINALHRREGEWRDDVAAIEAYRVAEDEKRRQAAERRGELVALDERRTRKR
jgi:hypothetical protein